MILAFRPLRNPNPLGFPGGVLPGFDPSHRAVKGMARIGGLSAIAAGGSFIDLLSGSAGTLIGTPTAGISNSVGPVTKTVAASLNATTFTGKASTFANVTIAGIFYLTSTATWANLFATSGDNAGGWSCGYSGGFQLYNINAGVTMSFSITASVNTPYFFVASLVRNTTTSNAVLINLATGAIKTGTSATATGNDGASNGVYDVGNQFTTLGTQTAYSWPGGIAAVMFAPTYLLLQDQLAWAADPWSFWYPRRDVMLVGAAAAAAFKAYWAQQSNLPVIGTGTY